MYSKIILLKTNGLSQGFSDLQAAENAAVAGDCVVVYPGTYDFGASQFLLKNGVGKKFLPGVIISSDHATATITDNNEVVVQQWEGEPTIINTLSITKRILFQNTNSRIHGFVFELTGIMEQTGTGAPTLFILKDTLKGVWTPVYSTVGGYKLVADTNVFYDTSLYGKKFTLWHTPSHVFQTGIRGLDVMSISANSEGGGTLSGIYWTVLNTSFNPVDVSFATPHRVRFTIRQHLFNSVV